MFFDYLLFQNLYLSLNVLNNKSKQKIVNSVNTLYAKLATARHLRLDSMAVCVPLRARVRPPVEVIAGREYVLTGGLCLLKSARLEFSSSVRVKYPLVSVTGTTAFVGYSERTKGAHEILLNKMMT